MCILQYYEKSHNVTCHFGFVSHAHLHYVPKHMGCLQSVINENI